MRCIVCSNPTFGGLYNNMLLKCKSCNFITTNYEISSNEVFLLYNNDYFKGKEYYNYLEDKFVIQTNFRKRLKTIDKVYPNLEMVSVLEIGCAYGFFGEIISQRFENQYFGFDVSKESIDFGRSNFKLSLHCEDYLSVNHKNNFYSDVFLWDVIEHLTHPELYLEKISNEMIEGGRIYLTTGDIESLLPRVQGKNWRLIHPPTHLHYFSKKTLEKLLDKYDFEVIQITYPALFRSIRLIFYSLFILNKNPNKFKNFILKFIPKKWIIAVNTFDIMFIIAEKKRKLNVESSVE